jgi:hypothetical protein
MEGIEEIKVSFEELEDVQIDIIMQAFKLNEMQAFAIRTDEGWMKRV